MLGCWSSCSLGRHRLGLTYDDSMGHSTAPKPVCQPPQERCPLQLPSSLTPSPTHAPLPCPSSPSWQVDTGPDCEFLVRKGPPAASGLAAAGSRHATVFLQPASHPKAVCYPDTDSGGAATELPLQQRQEVRAQAAAARRLMVASHSASAAVAVDGEVAVLARPAARAGAGALELPLSVGKAVPARNVMVCDHRVDSGSNLQLLQVVGGERDLDLGLDLGWIWTSGPCEDAHCRSWSA